MKKLWLFILIVASILLIHLFMLHHLGYSRPPQNEYPFPDEDTWRCDELGITLFLDEGRCIVYDGYENIICSVGRERGSNEIYINCNEFDNPKYNSAHLLFSGDFLGIDGDVFYVKDHSSGIEYAFCRVVE